MYSLFLPFWPCSSVVEQRKVHSEVVGSNPALAKIQFPYYNLGRILKDSKVVWTVFSSSIFFGEKGDGFAVET